MKEFAYVPKADSPFTGKITVKIPSHKERLKLMKQVSFDVQKDGTMEKKKGTLDSAVDMSEIIHAHVVKVELQAKVEDSFVEISSIEELGYYLEGSQIFNELGNLLIGGIRLGKS
jgi:hypothetical protein